LDGALDRASKLTVYSTARGRFCGGGLISSDFWSCAITFKISEFELLHVEIKSSWSVFQWFFIGFSARISTGRSAGVVEIGKQDQHDHLGLWPASAC
jgi:hypothetical protein